MTRVPLARPFVEPSLRHLHSFHDPAPGLRSERTHLDSAIRGSRTARCPLEGGIKRWHLYDRESSQLFFGVSVWAVLHAAFSVLNLYSGSRFRHLQRIASDKNAGLDERLVICAPGAGVGVASITFP